MTSSEPRQSTGLQETYPDSFPCAATSHNTLQAQILIFVPMRQFLTTLKWFEWIF